MKSVKLEMDKNRLERIWDEVIAMNRAAGPWGIFGAKAK
jgi:hypothetical protein